MSHFESKNEKEMFSIFRPKKSGMANTGESRRSSNFTFDMITFRIGPFRNFFKKFSTIFFWIIQKVQKPNLKYLENENFFDQTVFAG